MTQPSASARPADRKLFGTDGIRGVANGPQMTPELALSLGRALGIQIKNKNRTTQVVIGKDTRLSGYMIETALSSGLCSVGVNVELVGPLPTPGIAFLTQSSRADAGVVISASHNPFADNGIKIFGHDGFKLPDEREAAIEQLMASTDLESVRPTGAQIGRAHRIDDAVGRYVAYLKTIFPRELDLTGVKIAIDTAHGAAYRVAPLVFGELGAELVMQGDDPNGLNINEGVGALHPQSLAARVKPLGAQLGLCLDGDADRLILVDDEGEIVDGDQIMAMLARDFQSRGVLRGNAVAATVMSNIGLERSLKDIGVELLRTNVGDRYVVEAMRARSLSLGGEQSGHLVCLDHATTGDGVAAALLVLSIMRRSGKPLSELRKCMTVFPQTLVNLKVGKKAPLDTLPKVQAAIKKAEQALGQDGRVLVRFSGTEAKVRVMVEGPNEASIKAHAADIVSELEKELS